MSSTQGLGLEREIMGGKQCSWKGPNYSPVLSVNAAVSYLPYVTDSTPSLTSDATSGSEYQARETRPIDPDRRVLGAPQLREEGNTASALDFCIPG